MCVCQNDFYWVKNGKGVFRQESNVSFYLVHALKLTLARLGEHMYIVTSQGRM